MSHGHLFLSARDAVVVHGDAKTVWRDDAHQSALVLAPQMGKLYQVALYDAPSRRALARTVSAPELSLDAASERKNERMKVLFDFTQSTFVAVNRVPQEPIVRVQLSVDRQYLAIQKSDIEVQIIRVTMAEVHWIVCKSKNGNRILTDGVLWNTHSESPQSSQDVFLITRFGIEQYRVSAKRRSCSLHRTIGVFIHTFWYSAQHNVLIVSTGSRANEIVPFHMQGTNIERLPRLVFSTAVRKHDLYLASLYDELYAVYGDSKSTRLLLYLVGKAKVSCVRSLNVMFPPGTAIEFSVVDNLLVCHSVEFNVSLFFDVKCESNLHEAFSHPLPISLVSPEPQRRRNTLQKAASFHPSVLMDSKERSLVVSSSELLKGAKALMKHHPDDADDDGLSLSQWRFVSPDLVQRFVRIQQDDLPDTDRIEFRHLLPNLHSIAHSCAQHPEILPFLLRRGDQTRAKVLALALVREKLQEQVLSPTAVGTLLAFVQTVSWQELEGNSEDSSNDTSSDDERGGAARYGSRVVPMALRKKWFRDSLSAATLSMPQRNANGLTLVFQSDFDVHLWQPLLQGSEVARSGVLSVYIVEFIRNLQQNLVAVEQMTFIALASSYLVAKKTHELCQSLRHGIFTDSIALADVLSHHTSTHPALRQLVLDMYARMGAYAPLIQVLLGAGETDQAIEVAWQHMEAHVCDAAVLPGRVFFDAVARNVLSSTTVSSSLRTPQKLQSLLFFLRVWDPACLAINPEDGTSVLAKTTEEPFPDPAIPAAMRSKWRIAFGFPVETTEVLVA
ncbi:hypothetical protein Poli38472_006020 [Pythium oligandrum]|uniref:Mic1 domain-containing protein n=1 Tax=Pythium oligandrum TaxID=41045 RepID=A0A8K1FR28_PYTOL|nr:hypothetical protein Poli38472_006020 [Pythium oligandrum]|eukprot:TMW68552.1 hypothetical protein Poli38472_006020 [Pythium oligandrum]